MGYIKERNYYKNVNTKKNFKNKFVQWITKRQFKKKTIIPAVDIPIMRLGM